MLDELVLCAGSNGSSRASAVGPGIVKTAPDLACAGWKIRVVTLGPLAGQEGAGLAQESMATVGLM